MTHDLPADTGYRIRPPETWAAVKADYLAGDSAELVAERHGVGVSALHARARREGWRKADRPAPPPPPEPPVTDYGALAPGVLAHMARHRAGFAIEQGRLAEAERWTRLAARWSQAHDDAVAGPWHVGLTQLSRLARVAEQVARLDGFSASLLRAELMTAVADRLKPDPELDGDDADAPAPHLADPDVQDVQDVQPVSDDPPPDLELKSVPRRPALRRPRRPSRPPRADLKRAPAAQGPQCLSPTTSAPSATPLSTSSRPPPTPSSTPRA